MSNVCASSACLRSVYWRCNYAARGSLSLGPTEEPSLNYDHLSIEDYTRRYCKRTRVSRSLRPGPRGLVAASTRRPRSAPARHPCQRESQCIARRNTKARLPASGAAARGSVTPITKLPPAPVAARARVNDARNGVHRSPRRDRRSLELGLGHRRQPSTTAARRMAAAAAKPTTPNALPDHALGATTTTMVRARLPARPKPPTRLARQGRVGGGAKETARRAGKAAE